MHASDLMDDFFSDLMQLTFAGRSSSTKGFLEKFRCAKGNRLADDYATKGMQKETLGMPYTMETMPQHMR